MAILKLAKLLADIFFVTFDLSGSKHKSAASIFDGYKVLE
jgi:hypothetical protein